MYINLSLYIYIYKSRSLIPAQIFNPNPRRSTAARGAAADSPPVG